MSWQVPRIDQPGAYGDPFAMHSGGTPQIMPPGLSAEEQHFFSSVTTREYEEMARRKAEHMESAEHIAPQHNYPLPGKTSRYLFSCPARNFSLTRCAGKPNTCKFVPVLRVRGMLIANVLCRLSEKVLRDHFHLPLSEVAKKFGMCTTAFKKLCRKQGVMQWPHRTLRSLEKKIASLQAEQKFTNDHNSIEEQVRKLQMKREAILSGSGLANLDGDDLFTSPSDDSSSTAASGSSSPRAHDVLNALALDDSSSVGSSSSVTEERGGASSATSASSTGSLSARREGASREGALEYPQMPGDGMLGSEKVLAWDQRFTNFMMQQPGGRRPQSHPSGQDDEDAQMSRDPFGTLPQGHEANELMHRMRGGMMHRMRPGQEGPGPGDMAERHEAQRRGGLGGAGGPGAGPMPFRSPGGMGMRMGSAMHMGGGRFAGGAAGGMGAMHGAMGGHMMWYKDQPMAPRDGHEHPGPESAFFMGGEHAGMSADHPASNARLQQQVSYLLAENHNLRCVIRSMAKERDDYARKNDGRLPAPLLHLVSRC